MLLSLEEPPWFWLGGSSSFFCKGGAGAVLELCPIFFPLGGLASALTLSLSLSLPGGHIFAVDAFYFGG